jgi:murein L,D-transpeptidase YcbB/YkuD
MDSVIVNPSWYVPQSIIQNELLPQYQSDPNIFDRLGLEVKKGPDGNINVVQPPGAANALGRIKFNFPNKFQVYLHDTPEKNLFKYDKRAFSHGCMRVQDPTTFGEIILRLAMNGQTPNSRQLDVQFGHEERDFKLEKRPTVHLTYQTAFVDDAGKLQLRDDIYGFDKRIHAIMNSNERRIADLAPPPDPKRDLATAQSNQEILRRVERREALNPFHFFERLFR